MTRKEGTEGPEELRFERLKIFDDRNRKDGEDFNFAGNLRKLLFFCFISNVKQYFISHQI